MLIFLLRNKVVRGWDTYDSCVVIAEGESDARRVHPEKDVRWNEELSYWETQGAWVNGVFRRDLWSPASNETWCSPDQLEVACIGITDTGKRGVVLASFNAG